MWVDISARVGLIYRAGSGRYIECGVAVISTGADSFHRLADVDLSTLRPSAGELPTPLALSVDRLRRLGPPTEGTSVDRLGPLGGPTAALRSTDLASWVDRFRRLGRPTLSATRRASSGMVLREPQGTQGTQRCRSSPCKARGGVDACGLNVVLFSHKSISVHNSGGGAN